MVFCFQPLEIVAEPWGLLLQLLLARLKLPAWASPKKTHGCKSLLLQLLLSRGTQLRPRQGQETNRPAARALLRFPNRSVFLRFARSRRRPLRRGARFVEKASLTSGSTFRLCFSSHTLLQCFAFEASSFVRSTRAHGCCCWQAFAGSRLAWLPPRAPNSVFFSTSRRRLVEAGPW